MGRGLLAIVLLLGILSPALAADSMLVYRGGADSSVPETRTFDGSTFSPETTALDVTGTIVNVRVVAHPNLTFEEKVLCTQDGGNDLNCQVWNGTVWGDLLEVSTSTGGNTAFDVAYEQVSGTAMVCYKNSAIGATSDIFCSLWDGSSWTINGANATNVGGAVNNIKLVEDPNSDYLGLLVKDGSADLNAEIWNGTGFVGATELEVAIGGCGACTPFDGAWESSGDFVASWFEDNTDDLSSREFDTASETWLTQNSSFISGLSTTDTVYVISDSNPNSSNDEIITVVADGDDTLTVNEWDGNSWGAQSQANSNIGVVAPNNHPFYGIFERSGDFDFVMTHGITATSLLYSVYDSQSQTWTFNQSLPTTTTSENLDWHQLASEPTTQRIMLTTLGIVDDVETLLWSGSSWDASFTSQETVSNDAKWNAWFAWGAPLPDTTPPMIDFVDPTPANGTTLADEIDFNVTTIDTSGFTTTVYLYNTTDLVSSSASVDTPFTGSFSGLAAGTYFMNATAVDDSTNTNSTETREYTLTGVISAPNGTLSNVCGLVFVSVYPSLNFQDDFTPVNRTIATSVNIPIVYEWSSNNPSHSLEYTVTFNDTNFIQTVTKIPDQTENVQERDKYDVDFNTDYDISLRVVDAVGVVCDVNYTFSVDTTGLEEEKGLSISIAFFTLFGLVMILFLGSNGLGKWG